MARWLHARRAPSERLVAVRPESALGSRRKVSGTVRYSLKRLAAYLPLSRQAALVRHTLPRGMWFRAALTMARIHGRLISRMGGNGPFTTVMMLDFWLRELSFGGDFPIPYRVSGAEVVQAPGPKLYTWTHLPLTEVPLRVGLEVGGTEPAVVSDPGKVVGDHDFLVFGWPHRIEALQADAQLLRRVKASLQGGKSVVFLADPYLGAPLSEVPLRVAARLHVPLVFQWAELHSDGVLDVTFRLAPHPFCEGEQALAENLAFLREQNQAALKKLGWTRP